MDYINPYDLLNLKSDTLSDIDSSTIRRAKKNLLADIELGDSETISYNGIQLTKSSCIKAVDDLDNKDKAEFHYFIFKNPDLNHFLTKGSLNFFKAYKAESIYKLADFVDFISPFFTFQYDKQLALSYRGRKLTDVKQILSVKPITNESYKELCFKGTYAIVKEIENEVVAINNDITNKTSQFIEDSFSELSNLIAEKVDIELLNTLPNYFQSLRNSLAEKIRNIARDINNDPYNNYKPAFEIIEIANNIFTDGLVKQTISKGYYTIKKNYDDILPNPIPARPQPITTSPSIETKEDEEVEDDKIEKEATGYKRNKIATLILFASCGLLIWSIYNTTTRYVILSFYAFSYLSNLYKFFKSPEIYKANSQIDKIFFFTSIIVCTTAYFNNVAANFFLLYHFVGCCFTLFYDLALNKPYNKTKSFAYLVLALIGTYYLYTSQNVLEPQNSENKQELIEPLTDKQYFEKGQSLFNQSNFSEAILQYNEAIKLNPSYAVAYSDRGASKGNIGQFDGAIEDDKKAIELGLRNSIIYSNLGFAYYKSRQPDSAKHYFTIAIKIDSSNSNAYRYRGEVKYDANDNKGAVADYSLAIKFNPHASNYFTRGLGYYYLNDYKKAIQDMDKAIELSPNVGQYYFDRGDTKERMNNFDVNFLNTICPITHWCSNFQINHLSHFAA